MPDTPAARDSHAPSLSPSKAIPKPAPKSSAAETAQNDDPNRLVRLHITPFNPALLKVYIAPSVQPLAQNISFHATETFPEKGFGYVELPVMEAQKLKKKLNGSTLKGSKVRIEEAKPEKRKALAEADAADAAEEEKRVKRVKKVKPKKEQGVLEGVELPEGRNVKRGWTEPASSKKKVRKEEKNDKKDKEKREKKDASAKKEQKPSKYTKQPELLFNAKLTPAAAVEKLHKEKSKSKSSSSEKKAKKEKNKGKITEVTVHEFEHNTKYPTFMKEKEVKAEDKEPVEYINGKGWVAADGTVVEPETARARNRRALELVDAPPAVPKKKVETKKKARTPTPEPESEDDDSSVVSSSSEDPSSESESESEEEPESEAESDAVSDITSAPKQTTASAATPPPAQAETTESQAPKEVHPLEALFKRPKPLALPSFDANTTSTPPRGSLAPLNTSFGFGFGGDDADAMDLDPSAAAPQTPFTERDLEWRGIRSAAPTPDTAAIGRRFSFDWRAEDGEEEEDDDEGLDEAELEAGRRLRGNTLANAQRGSTAEEKGTGKGKKGQSATGEEEDGEEKEESEFSKWFWENRGDNNRAWKKRRRDTMKAKRLRENKKLSSGRL